VYDYLYECGAGGIRDGISHARTRKSLLYLLHGIRSLTTIAVSVTILIFLCGCTNLIRGRLYTHTVQPYSTDFKDTPVGTKKCVLTSHRIQEPASRAGLSAEWDTRTIRQAAQAAGIKQMHYADLSTWSIFWSVYRRRALTIYGD